MKHFFGVFGLGKNAFLLQVLVNSVNKQKRTQKIIPQERNQ